MRMTTGRADNTDSRPCRSGSGLATTVALGLGAWLAAAFIILLSVPWNSPFFDYRSFYYPVGRDTLALESPYTHFIPAMSDSSVEARGFEHTPVMALFFAPLALLPYAVAEKVWYCLNIGFIAVSAILLGRYGAQGWSALAGTGLVMVFLVSSAPIREVVRLGQVDIVLLLLSVVGLLVVEQGASRSSSRRLSIVAGMAFGAAASLKPYPFAFSLFYLWKRQYVLFISSVITGGVLLTVAVVILGPKVLVEYLEVLRLGGGPAYLAQPWTFSLAALAYRALTPNSYSIPFMEISPALISGLMGIWAVGVLLLVGRVVRRERVASHPLELAVVPATVLVIFPPLEPIHLAFLATTIPLLASPFWRRMTCAGVPDRRLALCLAVVVAVGAWLSLLPMIVGGRAMVWAAVICVGGVTVALIGLLWCAHLRAGTLVSGGLAVASYWLLTGPALQSMTAWWGTPVSGWRIILGGVQFYLLVAYLLLLVLLLARGRGWGGFRIIGWPEGWSVGNYRPLGRL
jgi:hypothetical protein